MPPIMSLFVSPEVILGLIALNLLFIILLTILFVRTNRMRKFNRKVFTGVGGDNLESSLIRLLDEMNEWKQKHSDQQFQLNRLAQKIANQCANLSVIRYNAFGDTGSDLSFSLALLDDNLNGVVITSIYGREESRTYAKPIEGGKSIYNLSEEELTAIKKASAKIG
ncbi:DUF4446 family protein [Brevibacillus migulae]|uniref:DUF4446 family protein n=1 Tax=Brevibacillus migulae TaxID=1644114 RepID=UPI001F2B60F7|nr:DUF4446 family protein [Brevibacillus migulae]